MRYSKTALGLLNAQYRSVLRKCMLINLGLFAITAVAATPANATDLSVNPGTFAAGGDAVTGSGSVSVTGLAISDTTGLQDALDGKVDEADITTGSTAGTISVGGSDVAVKDVATLQTLTDSSTGVAKAQAAIADASGNVITTTYATKNELNAERTATATLTVKPSVLMQIQLVIWK